MRPSPLVVYEEETLAHSLKLAGRCILCGPTAHQNLSRFAKELLAPVVEAALEKASRFLLGGLCAYVLFAVWWLVDCLDRA